MMARYEFKDIGEKIKKLRKEKDMTQSELADKLKIQKSTICNWETGYNTPKPDALRELATIFGVSTDYLLNYNCGDDGTNNFVMEDDDCNNYQAESSIHFTNEAIIDENNETITVQIKDESINKLLKPGDSALVSKRSALCNGD
jgi:transcriptional regulator with XRE-family HTH domain